jgi:hypothetical protein
VIRVGNGETKNGDAGGHYPMGNVDNWMRRGGRGVATAGIYAAWREESFGHGQNTTRGAGTVAGMKK